MERRKFLKFFIGGTGSLLSICIPRLTLAGQPARQEECCEGSVSWKANWLCSPQ